MKKDFCPPFTARSKIRSFRSHSHLSALLNVRQVTFPLLASVSFLLPLPKSSVYAAAHAEFLLVRSSPKHTSLLITYSSFPCGLYSADELQLCN